MEEPFRPELLDSAKATAMGYPTEQSYPSGSTDSGSSMEDLEKISGTAWGLSVPSQDMLKLPHKQAGPLWRNLRYNFITVYQRLFSIVFLANMTAFIVLLVQHRNSYPRGPSLSSVATAVSANILGAILIRQEHVINLLYRICCWTPTSWPLPIRRIIAKLYHFGGVHSGCAVSAVAWFVLFTALVTRNYASGDSNELATLVTTYILLILLLSICIFAIPKFRAFSHNSFEAVHRFAGWGSVGLFWVEILLMSHAHTVQGAWVRLPRHCCDQIPSLLVTARNHLLYYTTMDPTAKGGRFPRGFV